MMNDKIQAEINAENFIRKMCSEKTKDEQFIRNNSYLQSVEIKRSKKEEEMDRDKQYMHILGEKQRRIKETEEMLRVSMQKELKGTLDYQVNLKQRINTYQFGGKDNTKENKRPSQNQEHENKQREITQMESLLMLKQKTSQGFFNSQARKLIGKSQMTNIRSEEINRTVRQNLNQFKINSEIVIGQIREKLINRNTLETQNAARVPLYFNKRPDKVIREHVKCTDCSHVF